MFTRLHTMRKHNKGFTLIELLIVVAIIGIIAAILIPNLIDALQKAKQKRTVSDIRNTGTAWMSWLTDQVGAASAGQTTQQYTTDDFGPITHENLVTFLNVPTVSTFFYMQEVPQFDGWRHELTFARNNNLLAGNVMIICSPGRDGAYTSTVDACAGGQTVDVGPFIGTDYDQEIFWADGYMIRYPGNTKK
ncbi:MAG: prepilin-type N-terminal cleavage/methylation domain-containing protein [Acidobacteriota bacterium]